MTNHCQNMAIRLRETLKKSILEQHSEICGCVSGYVSGYVFLLQIGIVSGFAAIFLTANALCSPVRKENPASRACGKKKTLNNALRTRFDKVIQKSSFWVIWDSFLRCSWLSPPLSLPPISEEASMKHTGRQRRFPSSGNPGSNLEIW